MKVEEFMGSLKTFELNLKQKKKEKSIAFKAGQNHLDSGGDDDNEFALLNKNFYKFLKKMGKQYKSTLKGSNSTKGKNPSEHTDFFKKIKVFNLGNVKDIDTFNPSMQIP